jgi:dihydroflavonol-4-reductase
MTDGGDAPAGSVLVTGATGFLGSHLCRDLAVAGQDVRALCRPSSDRSVLADADVEWVVGDVTDRERMHEVVDGCERVYHLAGVGLAAADERTVRRVNVLGTEAVLDASLAANVDRVVFTSTAGTRRAEGVADETDVATPVGAYQESKARAESLVDRAGERGLDVVTVHPTSVFGPGDTEFTGRLFTLATNPAMVASLPGGVSFVGVADVVDGIRAAMVEGVAGEHYLLGGENHTFADALRIIADEIDGSRPLVTVPDPFVHAAGYAAEFAGKYAGVRVFPFDRDMARLATSELFYSSAKARRELGYEYRPLRELVGPAAAWYRGREGGSGANAEHDRRDRRDERTDPVERSRDVSD